MYHEMLQTMCFIVCPNKNYIYISNKIIIRAYVLGEEISILIKICEQINVENMTKLI